MRGLLGILGIGIMSLLVINPVYAMESMGQIEIQGQSIETPFGTIVVKPHYVDADNAAGIIEPAGGDNDGVGDFLFNSGFRCSAALLAESDIVPVALTAGHCVDDGFGILGLQAGATVTFETSCGDDTIGVEEAWTQIHPGWGGEFGPNGIFFGNDIALIELERFPLDCQGDNVDRYFIDRNAGDDVGLMPEDVGFGRSGVGATGDTLASGTKRVSTNTYDETSETFFPAVSVALWAPNSQLIDDFDNGNAANDANDFVGLTQDQVVYHALLLLMILHIFAQFRFG